MSIDPTVVMSEAVKAIKDNTARDYKHREEFFERLDYIQDDINQRAVSDQWVSWNYLEEALIRFLDKPDAEWKVKINNMLKKITSKLS